VSSVARASLGGIERSLQAQLAETVHRQLQSLREAAARLDLDMVAFIAHVLQGTVAGIGASQLAVACRQIEDRARTGELRDLDRLLSELDRNAAEVDAALARAAADS
jgi:HPt (histidine-containing phosphotransfer) domain-containing protein